MCSPIKDSGDKNVCQRQKLWLTDWWINYSQQRPPSMNSVKQSFTVKKGKKVFKQSSQGLES